MNDKLLTEAAWRTVAAKAKLKDNGLAKVLANAARLPDDDLAGQDAALAEAVKLAEKLLRDRLVAANPDAKEHLRGLLAAAGKERTALGQQIKAAAKARAEAERDEADEEDAGTGSPNLLAELNRLKNSGGKLGMQFLACPGVSGYELVVARRITPAMKEALKSKAGGKRLILGEVALEDGKCTFVTETAVTGLAKNLQKAIRAKTGKTLPLRARDASSGGAAEEAEETEEKPASASGATRGFVLEGGDSGTPAPASAAPPKPADEATDEDSTATSIAGVDDDGEPVRLSEIIAGSSGVQPSHGDSTNQTAAEGETFVEGSRAKAADATLRDSPMQSANLAGLGSFKLRYAIGFLCSDYSAVANKFPNLSDVAGYSKPNSKYLRTFNGMDRTQQYVNPKAPEILPAIREWVGKLAKELPKPGQGELVVSFQGHGEHGSFYACDGGEITKSDMLALARQAEKSRVSLTYVLDACYAGAAVADFQEHQAEAVEDRIDEFVEGEGLMSSEANHARAEVARRQMAHAKELIAFSGSISGHADTIEHALGRLEKHKTAANFAAVIKENTELIKLIRDMQKQFRDNLESETDPKMKLDAIRKAFNEVLAYLEAIPPRGPFNPPVWARTLGKFQDTISDGANRILRLLDAQARGARRRTRRNT